ncbi:DUF2332 domain-containing protein [Wenxinia marina]|uniref:DUF2332 domain-containing protein n=1 Tax=Wenxinia marina DSM 24838 TaxID=1123501 RepID=A0A0D0QIE7_9RHOB|nr:DUF2332 family protein [Wenxinia marina]KIQ70823.1 hypothetical protein Wenmar_00197 [Wenxinia marina DSM 24838]GGL57030.1 hypothetical protein GCM10011392_09360 [Wenxinia marina]
MTEDAPIRDRFRGQARACADLGSPFMDRLMTLFAERLSPDDGPVAEALFGRDWPKEAVAPLRIASGLHWLARGGDAALVAVYPPQDAPDDALWSAVRDAMEREAETLLRFLAQPPQTNEVRRSSVLIAGALVAAERHALPIEVTELGASAGLNLNFDRFTLEGPGWRRGPAEPVLTLRPDWRGPPPPEGVLDIRAREGVDLAPLDPTDPAARARLMAYLWPDQPQRLALTEAALAAADTKVEGADLLDWLPGRLAPREGRLHLVTHTIMWQYLPPEGRAKGEALFAEAGARATAMAPLARLSLEADDGGPGAAVRLTTWPSGATETLGRACFHGRWVDWAG